MVKHLLNLSQTQVGANIQIKSRQELRKRENKQNKTKVKECNIENLYKNILNAQKPCHDFKWVQLLTILLIHFNSFHNSQLFILVLLRRIPKTLKMTQFS